LCLWQKKIVVLKKSIPLVSGSLFAGDWLGGHWGYRGAEEATNAGGGDFVDKAGGSIERPLFSSQGGEKDCLSNPPERKFYS